MIVPPVPSFGLIPMFIHRFVQILMISFAEFKLEEHHQCIYDFLQIHDGPSAGSHQIGRYCGEDAPQGGHFNSTHNQLYFWFRSDSSRAHDGFVINWHSALPCKKLHDQFVLLRYIYRDISCVKQQQNFTNEGKLQSDMSGWYTQHEVRMMYHV